MAHNANSGCHKGDIKIIYSTQEGGELLLGLRAKEALLRSGWQYVLLPLGSEDFLGGVELGGGGGKGEKGLGGGRNGSCFCRYILCSLPCSPIQVPLILCLLNSAEPRRLRATGCILSGVRRNCFCSLILRRSWWMPQFPEDTAVTILTLPFLWALMHWETVCF